MIVWECSGVSVEALCGFRKTIWGVFQWRGRKEISRPVLSEETGREIYEGKSGDNT